MVYAAGANENQARRPHWPRLDILKKEPTYRFHLGAQTVVLEDYLSIRAGSEQELRQYISEGRFWLDHGIYKMIFI